MRPTSYSIKESSGRKRRYIVYACRVCGKLCKCRTDRFKFKHMLCLTHLTKHLIRERTKKRNYELLCAKYLKTRFQTRYQHKGLGCSLTPEEILKLTKQNCIYCNRPPRNTFNYRSSASSKTYKFLYNGLDRVNSKKGYCLGNVVPCCAECNRAKSNMSYKAFTVLVKRIYEHLSLGGKK